MKISDWGGFPYLSTKSYLPAGLYPGAGLASADTIGREIEK